MDDKMRIIELGFVKAFLVRATDGFVLIDIVSVCSGEN